MIEQPAAERAATLRGRREHGEIPRRERRDDADRLRASTSWRTPSASRLGMMRP